MPLPPSLWSETHSPFVTPILETVPFVSLLRNTFTIFPKLCPSSLSHAPSCLLQAIKEERSTTLASDDISARQDKLATFIAGERNMVESLEHVFAIHASSEG